eukprot:2988999-Pleurochrysis_carterae.AAC.1
MDVAAPCAGRCLHGTCVNGTCVCNSGWSGNADLLTGDLSTWGGPVVDCNTDLQALKDMWSVVLSLCIIALLLSPMTMCQQWEKLKALRTQGFRRCWFQYPPLFYVTWHAGTVGVVLSMAAIKITEPDFRRVVGIDRNLSICYALVHILGEPISFVFVLNLLATFSGGLQSEMAPTPWFQWLVKLARFIFAVAGLLSASTGLYMLVYLSVSPLSGRHIHELCHRLVFSHTAVSSLLVAIASVIFTMEMLRNLNHTVRERAILSKWTKSAELIASCKSLRKTRLKVAMLQLTIITCCIINCGIDFWLISDSTSQQYASYCLAYEFAAYMQVVLLVLLTYTSVDVPSWRRRLESALLLRRFNRHDSTVPSGETSDSGAAAQRLDTAIADAPSLDGTPASLVAQQQHTTCASGTAQRPATAAIHVVVSVSLESDARCTETVTGPASSSLETPQQQREAQLEQQQELPSQQPNARQLQLNARRQAYWDC